MNTTPSPLVCYQPSGRVSWRAPVRLIFVAFPISLLFGWLYALARFHSPHMVVSLVEWAIFSVSLGVLAGMVLESGHSRSPRFNSWAGAAIGFVALWAQWIVTLKQYGPGQVSAVQFASSGPLTWIRIVNELATRLHAQNPRLDVLLLVWAAEAAVVIALPTLLARMGSTEPYSEATKAWAKKDGHGELWWPDAAISDLMARLHTDGVPALLTMERAATLQVTPVASEWWTVSVEGRKVDSDPTARWLTIQIVVQTRDDAGRVKARRQPVVDRWRVTDSEYRAVMAHLAPVSPPAAETHANEETPPELVASVQALKEERLDDVLALARPYAGADGAANSALRADANRLCALALSHQENYLEALPYWKVLNDLDPTAHNLLQVASTSAVLGDVANAERWFDEALKRAHDKHHADMRPAAPMMVANFVTALHRGGHSRAAFERLKVLAGWYACLPVTDSHYVYTRGMPFFSTFVKEAAPIVRSVAGEVDIQAWYDSIYGAVDEEGQALLAAGRASWGLG